MQEQQKKLLKELAKIIKVYRGDKSISMLSNEINLSKSIWSELEKGNKDIQFSTFWRIAEALDIKPSLLVAEIEDKLGKNFSFIEDSLIQQ